MNQQVSRRDQLKPVLEMIQKQITSLLNGDKERANKLIASALAIGCDPALRNCSPESIGQAVIGVAMMDFNIDKNIGHCYLVPYQGSGVQLQIGYKGMIQLLFRAGWMVKAFPVFECDEFTFDNNGWDNKVVFKQNIDERDEGDRDWCYQNLRGIYVVSRNSETADEYSIFVNKKVIEKLRKVSPNQKNSALPSGIWKDWYIEMATAKAIKRLAKLLPIGDSRASLGIAIDDKADMGKSVDYSKTADSGVVIDLEAEAVTKVKLRSVDSLVGGESEIIVESVIPNDSPDFIPPVVETVIEPVATLQPEPAPITPEFLNLHQEWRNVIMQWQSKLDFTKGLNDMPTEIKTDVDIKKFMTTRQNFCRQNYPDIW